MSTNDKRIGQMAFSIVDANSLCHFPEGAASELVVAGTFNGFAAEERGTEECMSFLSLRKPNIVLQIPFKIK